MNLHCLLFCLLFSSAYAQKQDFFGRYNAQENFVIISDSTVEFKTFYGCCLSVELYGYGKYKFNGDSIMITIALPPKNRISSFQILNDTPKANQVIIKVENKEGIKVSVKPFFLNNYIKEMQLVGTSKSQGLFVIDSLTKEDIANEQIHFTNGSFDDFEVPVKEVVGKTIMVTLKEYKILRGEQVVFKISSNKGSNALIGPFFPISKERKVNWKKERRAIFVQNLFRFWPWKWNMPSRHLHHPTPKVFVLE